MRHPASIALALGVAMILFVATGGNLVASLVSGALIGLLAVYYSRSTEGFANEEDDEEGFEDAEDDVEAKPTAPPKKKKRAAKKAPVPPDNGERAEMFELGKKYKGPDEADDGEGDGEAGQCRAHERQAPGSRTHHAWLATPCGYDRRRH